MCPGDYSRLMRLAILRAAVKDLVNIIRELKEFKQPYDGQLLQQLRERAERKLAAVIEALDSYESHLSQPGC